MEEPGSAELGSWGAGHWVMDELGTGEMSSRGGAAVSGVEFPGSWDAGLWGTRDQRSQAHRESEYRIPEEPGSAELNFPGGGIPRDGGAGVGRAESPGSCGAGSRGAQRR